MPLRALASSNVLSLEADGQKGLRAIPLSLSLLRWSSQESGPPDK